MGPITKLQFKPLDATIGAEVSGVDFSKELSDDIFTQIEQGCAKYGVLVFRKTGLDDAHHVAFASRFGELDDVTHYLKEGRKHRLPYVELFDVGNIEDDGSVMQKDSLRYQTGLGNGIFHVDSSFNPRRASHSILKAHELPPRGTGGATEFADTRQAYDDLDDPTKEGVKDYIVHHSLWHSRKLAAPDCEYLKEIDPLNYFMGKHQHVKALRPRHLMRWSRS